MKSDMKSDLGFDTLDLGYDELQQHGCRLDTALAASDCRIEIALAYLHAIAAETRDAGALEDGIWHIARTLALLDARGFRT
jgi:hypothetical protein